MTLRLIDAADWNVSVTLMTRDPATGAISPSPIDLTGATARFQTADGVDLGVGAVTQAGASAAWLAISQPAAGRAPIDFGGSSSLLVFIDLYQGLAPASVWVGRLAATLYRGS